MEEALIDGEICCRFESNDGAEFFVSCEDADMVSANKWYSLPRNKSKTYIRKAGKKIQTLHRILMGHPIGATVDHINGNPLDNRRSNLRVCSIRENSANRRKFRSEKHSQYLGVGLTSRGEWRSYISCNYKFYALGTYANEIDAAKAHDAAALYFNGEYAVLNFRESKPESPQNIRDLAAVRLLLAPHMQKHQYGVGFVSTSQRWSSAFSCCKKRFMGQWFRSAEEAAEARLKAIRAIADGTVDLDLVRNHPTHSISYSQIPKMQAKTKQNRAAMGLQNNSQKPCVLLLLEAMAKQP